MSVVLRNGVALRTSLESENDTDCHCPVASCDVKSYSFVRSMSHAVEAHSHEVQVAFPELPPSLTPLETKKAYTVWQEEVAPPSDTSSPSASATASPPAPTSSPCDNTASAPTSLPLWAPGPPPPPPAAAASPVAPPSTTSAWPSATSPLNTFPWTPSVPGSSATAASPSATTTTTTTTTASGAVAAPAKMFCTTSPPPPPAANTMLVGSSPAGPPAAHSTLASSASSDAGPTVIRKRSHDDDDDDGGDSEGMEVDPPPKRFMKVSEADVKAALDILTVWAGSKGCRVDLGYPDWVNDVSAAVLEAMDLPVERYKIKLEDVMRRFMLIPEYANLSFTNFDFIVPFYYYLDSTFGNIFN